MFLGPTASSSRSCTSIDVFPPASLGAVYRAWEAGYRRIAIVDGYFGNVPSVWHKEILYVMSEGAEVWGAASTGALRAAELYEFGMKGVGRIFRLYRRNSITDDDEVCVEHAVSELGYMPLTVPVINLRFTLRLLRRANFISIVEERTLITLNKGIFFASRTWPRVIETIRDVVPRARVRHLSDACRKFYFDAKKIDGDLLLRTIEQTNSHPPDLIARAAVFERNIHWVTQFERHKDQIPMLGQDVFSPSQYDRSFNR